jgi:hypothetical protein
LTAKVHKFLYVYLHHPLIYLSITKPYTFYSAKMVILTGTSSIVALLSLASWAGANPLPADVGDILAHKFAKRDVRSFWIGNYAGEQDCGGVIPQDCNVSGTWVMDNVDNFCSNVHTGSPFPALNGAATNWCNITVAFTDYCNGHDMQLSNVGSVAQSNWCGQNGGDPGATDGTPYAALYDMTAGPDYSVVVGGCTFDSTVNNQNCPTVVGSIIYGSNIVCNYNSQYSPSCA